MPSPSPISTLFPYTTLFRSTIVQMLTDYGYKGWIMVEEETDEANFNTDQVIVDIGEYVRKNLQRSEEHTCELQSRGHLVCRLLLEKKNYNNNKIEPA